MKIRVGEAKKAIVLSELTEPVFIENSKKEWFTLCQEGDDFEIVVLERYPERSTPLVKIINI
jgi:hypothetical protein